jgi:hypothetical protein
MGGKKKKKKKELEKIKKDLHQTENQVQNLHIFSHLFVEVELPIYGCLNCSFVQLLAPHEASSSDMSVIPAKAM